MGQISVAAAAEHLKHGALVIDVRSPAEFSSAHLRQAINMPLPEIEQLIAGQVKDKNQVLLLHCQSGGRSGAAKKKLAALGYAEAYNLGSYDRAARIVGGV
jgi:phage shock protein E